MLAITIGRAGMVRKALLVVLVTITAFAALLGLLPESKHGQLYFPIRVGDRRELVNEAGVVSTHEVKSVEKRKDYWLVTESISSTADLPTLTAIHQVSETGLLSVNDILFGKRAPQQLLKLAPGGQLLPDGTTWEVDDPGTTPGNYLRFIYTVGAEEEIEVPAGKYKAVKVEMRSKCEVDGRLLPETSRATTWYAKRVGQVKGVQTTPDGQVIGSSVLKSFTPAKG
jgi:hypothetical protein